MTLFAGCSTEAEDNPFNPWLFPLVWPRCYNTEKTSIMLTLMLLVRFPAL